MVLIVVTVVVLVLYIVVFRLIILWLSILIVRMSGWRLGVVFCDSYWLSLSGKFIYNGFVFTG